MISFKAHAKRLKDLNKIPDIKPCVTREDDLEVARVSYLFREIMPITTMPECFEREITIDDVRSHFINIKRPSSPGVPWHSLGVTKGEILDKHSDLIVEAVLDRLNVLGSVDLFDPDPIWLVENFFVDPVRLFIKDEPHNRDKREAERYRLISSCSIVDELVTRILFSKQVFFEIDRWEMCFSKAGMGLSTDDQQQRLFDSVKPWLKHACSNDMKNWDWSVREWLMKFCIRCHLFNCNANAKYTRLCMNWVICLARTVYSTSDGVLLCLNINGIQKSGSFMTAKLNGMMRAAARFLVEADSTIIVMGDDAVEKMFKDMISKYATLGLEVKASNESNGETFSFCSHTFKDGEAFPENVLKSFFRLLYNGFSEEFVDQFKMENHKLDLSHFLEFIETHAD